MIIIAIVNLGWRGLKVPCNFQKVKQDWLRTTEQTTETMNLPLKQWRYVKQRTNEITGFERCKVSGGIFRYITSIFILSIDISCKMLHTKIDHIAQQWKFTAIATQSFIIKPWYFTDVMAIIITTWV